MYVQPKTSFIYIPKYSVTSSWERALELSRENVRKLDHALDLAAAARDHNFALLELRDNMINTLAHEYNIPETKIKEIKKEELIKLPEDLKKDIDPESIEKILNS